MSCKTHTTEQTRTMLTQHCQAYPQLREQDIFKYLYQSAFGCEHLVSDESTVLRYLQSEYAAVQATASDRTEPLDGSYSRVHLGVCAGGLRPGTLARLFCLSARKQPNGRADLEQKLEVANEMVAQGELPLHPDTFVQKLNEWRAQGFPAVHHSAAFRETYHPAYRVIANQYAYFLSVFTEIDKRLSKGSAIIAIEGGSASGKTTLASMLQQVYGCNVFHTDDFFLRPGQRTAARLSEIGGNLDRERFADEIVKPLMTGKQICYRRFDCSTQTLGELITVPHTDLTVIEGTYSMHPAFGDYFDLAIFLDVHPDLQKKRITLRNTPQLAKRFFDEWIPLENEYFTKMDIKTRTDLLF